ncbi:hypothetical protein CK203_054540 [Vitis vinifera]|uniref:Uncharacterized protein n=1 Tax=Vitis vinifera TaxID=29760 RepID=A0A438GQI0_VITVI|nr:hypothetical protein CK203_054540 [Vitis vinifera]
MVNLDYGGKYHVADINYSSYTIRVVDPGLKKRAWETVSPILSITCIDQYHIFPTILSVVFITCPWLITGDKIHKYIPIIPCNTNRSSPFSQPYAYAIVGDLEFGDIPDSCILMGISSLIKGSCGGKTFINVRFARRATHGHTSNATTSAVEWYSSA